VGAAARREQPVVEAAARPELPAVAVEAVAVQRGQPVAAVASDGRPRAVVGQTALPLAAAAVRIERAAKQDLKPPETSRASHSARLSTSLAGASESASVPERMVCRCSARAADRRIPEATGC
jgi:hypothetical protein